MVLYCSGLSRDDIGTLVLYELLDLLGRAYML